MKTVKTKLHHRRKARSESHAAPIPQDAAELWQLDHDYPDPDLISFQMERSPKQENL